MRLTLGVAATLLSVIAADAQVQSPTDIYSGRIAGYVVTTFAELVGDATVRLTTVNDQDVNFQSRTTRTDASGAFSFEQLPEGRYRVVTSKQGYTSRQLLDSVSEPWATFDVGPAVDLPPDGQVLNLEVVLRRAASIEGRIIRSDGSAAPNVRVQAAIRSGTGRARLLQAQTATESDGRYEITDLPPGEYLVGALNVTIPTGQLAFDDPETVQAGQAAPPDVHWSWYPGVEESEPGNSVTLLEGVKAEGIDIWLTPSQRFSVSGRVFWPVGVVLKSIAIDYGDPAGTRSGVSLVPDPGGLFTLTAIAPGALTMLARADSDQGPLIGLASTEVTRNSVEDVKIVVDRPGRITGRIVYEGNVPPSGRATAIVAVQKLLKVSETSQVPESTVDANGRFDLTGAVGEYEFALDGLQSNLAVKRVMRNGRSLAMNRIAVAAGETIRDIEIVVGP